MNVLITGSRGFIGKACVGHFGNKAGVTVYECDIIDHDAPRYTKADAASPDYFRLLGSSSFDLCIVCSGASSVPASIEAPGRDRYLSVDVLDKLLDAIRSTRPQCKVIHLSSAAVYGNPVSLPVTEDSPLAPLSPYGIHKKMAEELCTRYHKEHGLPVCSLRIFSAFGAGLKKQLFWDLYERMKSSNDISLSGTGNESRDFIYITDLVEAIGLVANNAAFEGEAINVANGKEITIREAARTFLDLAGFEGKLGFTGKIREGDPVNWRADISKLQRMGYKGKVSIEQGLTKYLEWLREEG